MADFERDQQRDSEELRQTNHSKFYETSQRISMLKNAQLHKLNQLRTNLV